MRISLFPSTLSNRTHFTTKRTPSDLFGKTIWTTLHFIWRQVQRKVSCSQLHWVRNHDGTVRERFFDEGQEVFVRPFLGRRKYAHEKFLRRSDPLSYEVIVRDQVYFRNASQLLPNSTGHQDLSDTQQDQLMDIYLPQKHSMSQNARKLGANLIIPKSTSNALLHFQFQRLTKNFTSTSGSASQLLQTTQRALTSISAHEAGVPPPTRSLRTR